MSIRWLPLAGLGLLFAGMPVQAHQMNVTTARLVQSADRSVRVDLGIKAGDVERVTGMTIADPVTGAVDAAGLADASAPLARYVADHSTVSDTAGKDCPATPATVRADGDGVAVMLTWSCVAVPGPLVYRSSVLIERDPTARQIVLLGEGDDAPAQMLDATTRQLALGAPPPSLGHVLLSYLWAGIEHIATGYDHMAFLVAVVMWGRRLWPLVKVVTAFTLSHSVTLSLSALGIVVIPESITEPAIAATIIYVAVENFFSRDIDRRWIDTLLFGFIHGFGFASALREVGLPRHALLPALGAFNLGVEIGQVTVIALALPVLIAFDRWFGTGNRDRRLVYGVSAMIGVLGVGWFLGRTVFEGWA